MRALILSGGGAKGAFSVGALNQLANSGTNSFDIISGTSTGSLIAALVCNKDFKLLKDIYLKVKDDDILARQNIVENLTSGKPYLFDTTPLREMINTHVTDAVYTTIKDGPTLLCLTAVNLQTGRPTVFSSRRIDSSIYYDAITIRSAAHLRKALEASSNQAAFLPPVTMTADGSGPQYVDGGNREVLPTRVVSIEMPTAPSDPPHEVYVVSNNPSTPTPGKPVYDKFMDVLLRAISMFVQDVRENDIQVIREYCSKAQARLITIEPRTDLDPDNPTGLRFSKQLMAGWMVEGMSRAKLALEAAALNA